VEPHPRSPRTFQIPSLQQRGKGLGIVRLDDSLAELVQSGKVTLEAAQTLAEAPDELASAARPRSQGGLKLARIDGFFDQLLSMNGSDLHLGVAIRLSRACARARAASRRAGQRGRWELLFEITSPEQRQHIEGELDLDFAYAYGQKARFRANYLYKMSGLGAVFRVIPTKIPTLADLGCPPAIQRLAERRAGLVLVTGPTGSGKSTTLAAMINYINRTPRVSHLDRRGPGGVRARAIARAGDPSEVGQHTKSFASAIRSAAREDPQVICRRAPQQRNDEARPPARKFRRARVRHGPHQQRVSTIERIINAFPADEQPRYAACSPRACRDRGPAAAQDVRRQGPPRRARDPHLEYGIASMIREGKTYQITSLMQSGQAQGMQTMDVASSGSLRPAKSASTPPGKGERQGQPAQSNRP